MRSPRLRRSWRAAHTSAIWAQQRGSEPLGSLGRGRLRSHIAGTLSWMKTAVLIAAGLASLIAASTAFGSEIIDRNARNVRLGVDANGQALVTYTVRGRVMHVRAWGAINARQPSKSL